MSTLKHAVIADAKWEQERAAIGCLLSGRLVPFALLVAAHFYFTSLSATTAGLTSFGHAATV